MISIKKLERPDIEEAIKANGGYCPCIISSRGVPKYKCMCEDFRRQKDGECHCGLFIKIQEATKI